MRSDESSRTHDLTTDFHQNHRTSRISLCQVQIQGTSRDIMKPYSYNSDVNRLDKPSATRSQHDENETRIHLQTREPQLEPRTIGQPNQAL